MIIVELRPLPALRPGGILSCTMARISLVALTLISMFVGPVTAQHANNEKRLLAYYPEWVKFSNPAYTAEKIPYKKLTHIAHAFATLPGNPDGTLRIPEDFIEPALISKAHAAGVKVLLSIGGGDGVQGPRFNRMARDEDRRQRFARNVHTFLETYGYDGVDIDWEVPNAADRANCTTLMQELRDELPASRWIIAMAIPADPRSWGVGFDVPALAPILDFINVMTYDFHGPWSDHAGHNSPLALNPDDPELEGSVETSMDLFANDYAVPLSKLNFGTAFYGYEFRGIRELWEHCDGCEVMGRNYAGYIKSRVNHGDWKLRYDNQAKAPYLLNEAVPSLITFDDATSTRRKTNYVLKQRGMGGVFMWDLSADYDGKSQDLLDAMYSAWQWAK